MFTSESTLFSFRASVCLSCNIISSLCRHATDLRCVHLSLWGCFGVNRGDGTAKFGPIFNGNGNKSGVDLQNDSLITLSMHCDSNYPSYKAHSSYDVPLPDKMGDEEYLKVLKENVERALQETKPDFVLYDAGVDVHRDDLLGRLWLSEDGIRARDRWVIEKCVKDGIPVAAVIGGGYDKDETVLASRHAIVHEEAAYIWRKYKMWSR
mmetsp:Transcript_10260/g.15013  ORF Transcript_10260/g.15013 Transcript_10260/m.15013 type:complete len:208 (-) Transcript_10260:158-781(-)